MDFFEVLKKRHSIRVFQDKEIEEEKVKKILEAANSAPSAGNLQAYEIYVVRDKKKRQRLAQAASDQEFVALAPAVLVFCVHPSRSAIRYGERGEKLYSWQDATIAATFSLLAIYDLGLGAVWVGAFSEKEVGKILEISKALIPVAVIPFGYPAEKPEQRARRSLDDLVHNL